MLAVITASVLRQKINGIGGCGGIKAACPESGSARRGEPARRWGAHRCQYVMSEVTSASAGRLARPLRADSSMMKLM